MNFLLSIACGKGQVSHLNAAKSLGYKVIGVDRNKCATNVYRHIQQSTYSAEACIDAIKKVDQNSIVGVICRASGPAIATANKVAKKLHLPRCGDLIARMAQSKLGLFHACMDLSIQGVKTRAVDCVKDLENFNGKLLVKPDVGVDGKKDIYILDGVKKDTAVFIEKAKFRSINGVAVVSPFIEGRDIGFATLSLNGQCVWQCFYEESVKWLNDAIINSSMSMGEAQIPNPVRLEIINSSLEIIRCSSATGFVYFSFRVSNSQAYLYEVNSGLAGDGLVESIFHDNFPKINFLELDVLAMCNRFDDIMKIINGGKND